MAKKKVYAVKKGKKPGIYDSWEACSAAVSGYSGAEYKGFGTEAEARAWLGEPVSEEKTTEKSEVLTAYVDGSFDQAVGRYSFGCILLTPEGEVIRECGSGKEPDSLAIRNVAGEMLGAMYAVQWAVNHGYAALVLRYDYEGIEKWATGAWKARNALTQKYAAFMMQKQNFVSVAFEKVRAHSGDYYNEEADTLAKQALTETDGIPKVPRKEFS